MGRESFQTHISVTSTRSIIGVGKDMFQSGKQFKHSRGQIANRCQYERLTGH